MIPTDDPRHGTNRGYLAGCGEACCKAAHAAYRRDLRSRQYLAGGPLTVDATGTQRRIQALTALGWPGYWIDDEIGRVRTYTTNILAQRAHVLASTADLIADVYDRLSMTLPPTDTLAQRQVVSRARNLARRKGWPPPLAWDDIDDPTEHPTGWEYHEPTRTELLEEVLADGLGAAWACAQLGIKDESLQRWCANHGLTALYQQLAARDGERQPNQYAHEDAA